MSSWKYTGSPYLPGADNAHRIESSRTAGERLRARDEAAKKRPVGRLSGSELAPDREEPPVVAR